MKKIKIAKYGIYEYAVYNIYKILSYENLIYLKEYYEKEKRKFPISDFAFKRIGNYIFLVRAIEEKDNIDNFIIKFQINDRKNNKNLFEWIYLFDYSKEAKDFIKALDGFFKKISEINYIEHPFLDEPYEENLKRKLDKIDIKKKFIVKYLKEVFKEKFEEFDKIIDFLLQKEYDKKYKFQDIEKRIFFNSKIETTYPLSFTDEYDSDDYYLYYLLDNDMITKFTNNKITKEDLKNEIEVLDFYSFPLNELEENKNLKFLAVCYENYMQIEKNMDLKEFILETLILE